MGVAKRIPGPLQRSMTVNVWFLLSLWVESSVFARSYERNTSTIATSVAPGITNKKLQEKSADHKRALYPCPSDLGRDATWTRFDTRALRALRERVRSQPWQCFWSGGTSEIAC